jgi:hypothetical protein
MPTNDVCWSKLWEISGKVVGDRIHRETKGVVAGTIEDAMRGFERWAQAIWSDTREVEITGVKLTLDSLVIEN